MFESNATFTSPPPPNGLAVFGNGGGGNSVPGAPRPQQDFRDSDELVTRAHWQKTSANDFCLEPACRRPLGVVNGCVNCEFWLPRVRVELIPWEYRSKMREIVL